MCLRYEHINIAKRCSLPGAPAVLRSPEHITVDPAVSPVREVDGFPARLVGLCPTQEDARTPGPTGGGGHEDLERSQKMPVDSSNRASLGESEPVPAIN